MKRIVSMAAAACCLIPSCLPKTSSAAGSDTVLDRMVCEKLMEMKSEYPEGTPWTNENYYRWNGGIVNTGFGCAGFAFMLSDYVYGSIPAVKSTDFSNIRAGDLIRMNNDTHTVVVLSVSGNTATIAEGNFNRSVHWGRKIDLSDRESLTYVMKRTPKKGDVSLNTSINAEDASLVLEEYAAVSTNSPSVIRGGAAGWAADVDGDGAADPDDATLILGYYAYLSTGGSSSHLSITDWMKSGK